jgi:hypothetical protein
VSDVAAIRDYVDPTVVTFVAAGDPAALREALASDPPDRVAAARAHVLRGFTAQRLSGDLAALCREAAAGSRRHRRAAGA